MRLTLTAINREKRAVATIRTLSTSPRSSLKILKNCARSEILPQLQANKSFWHTVIWAGRRHAASESDTKDIVLLTAIVVVRVSAFAPVPLRPNSHKVTKESQLPP